MRPLALGITLLGIVVLLCGCQEVLLTLGLLAQRAQFEQALAGTPCAGRPCEPRAWMRIAPSRDYEERGDGQTTLWSISALNARVPGAGCLLHLTLPYVEPYNEDNGTGELFRALRVRRSDLKLAIMSQTGRVHVASFGASTEEATASLDAVGIAWSNVSGQLAVVSPSPSGQDADDFLLRLMDEALNELQSLPFNLVPAERLNGGDLSPVVVSWSSDDLWIAVSVRGETAIGQPLPPPGCVLLPLGDGGAITRPLYSAYFVGPDQLVASEPSAGGTFALGQVYLYRLEQERLVRVSRVFSARCVITSDPLTGVFLTCEPFPPAIGLPIVGFRMPNREPQRIIEPGIELAIVPWNEQTRAVLDAAGLSPDRLTGDPETGYCALPAGLGDE